MLKLVKSKDLAMRNIIIAIAILIICIVPVSLMANGTAAGSGITNGVTASFSNAGNAPYTTSAFVTNQPVQAIFGLKGQISNYSPKPVNPGSFVTYSVIITNKGNTNITIALTNIGVRSNASAGIWTYNFYTNALTNGGRVKYVNLAEEQAKTLFLYVFASALATNGTYITNMWGTHISNNYQVGLFTTLKAYTNLNGIVYGGRDFYTNSIAFTFVQAPVIRIEKRSDVTNSASYRALTGAANWKKLVPGSMIVYVITWTNAGSGVAQRLNFSDPIKSATMTYVPNSMVFTNGLRIKNNYFQAYTNAGSVATRRLADNGTVTRIGAQNYNGITGSTNTVAGSLNVKFRYTGATVPANSAGTLMYKVFVK